MKYLSDGSFATGPAPLAGSSFLDAEDLDEAIRLVADTPCARARGAIEVWADHGDRNRSRRIGSSWRRSTGSVPDRISSRIQAGTRASVSVQPTGRMGRAQDSPSPASAIV
jgi:hypothetical protein